MKLALGPVLYYWDRDTMLGFYKKMADAPVDIVYLGETVCSRRHLLGLQDYLDMAQRLAAAGKEVVLSTQTLIESESDLKGLRKIVRDGRFLVEANEWGAVRLLSEAGLPFVAGPTLNVYNPETLDVLAGLGGRRWLPPVEVARGAGSAARAGAGQHRNRGVRLRPPAARLFGSLLHGAPLQPAQGRLPVPLPRPSIITEKFLNYN